MKLAEVIGMLKAAKNFEEINYKRNEIAELIPDISRMFGYDQSNYAHPYDLEDRRTFPKRFYVALLYL